MVSKRRLPGTRIPGAPPSRRGSPPAAGLFPIHCGTGGLPASDSRFESVVGWALAHVSFRSCAGRGASSCSPLACPDCKQSATLAGNPFSQFHWRTSLSADRQAASATQITKNARGLKPAPHKPFNSTCGRAASATKSENPSRAGAGKYGENPQCHADKLERRLRGSRLAEVQPGSGRGSGEAGRGGGESQKKFVKTLARGSRTYTMRYWKA